MPAERLTKDQRRDAAREAARMERERQKQRESRNRLLLRGGVTLAILAVLGVVALIVVLAVQPPGPGPKNMLSDGALLTSEDGTVIRPVETKAIPSEGKPVATDQTATGTEINIVIYLDYFCPFCAQFEATNAAQIEEMVKSGQASLEVHPIAILDKSSLGTRYSSRAANAMACVANFSPGSFYPAGQALFSKQPAENTVGLTNDEIIGAIGTAGVLNDQVSSCIKNETFKAWVTASTKRALKGPLPNSEGLNVKGTPTVLVNGVQYTGPLDNAQAFTDFVIAQIPPVDTQQ